MERDGYQCLERLAREPHALSQTISYVAKQMERFVRKREYVLICFPRGDHESLGTIFEQAALQLDAVPIFWGPDHKWKTLLRQAFATRASTIIGPPLVVLGLSKLTKATRTPLYIRNVVTAGYPCLDWMIDGIIRGLDCRTWGCFGLGTGAVVGGFSCGHSRGVHIREDVYDIGIVDENGTPVPGGVQGSIAIAPKGEPGARVIHRDHARLERGLCPCGQTSPRLMDIRPMNWYPADVQALKQELQSWTSILDCRVERGQYGLEIELVVFPGEKLPKLPSAAKLVIRHWDPDRDAPFGIAPEWEPPV